MKSATYQQEQVAFHVRIFSQAELRCLMIVSVLIGIVLDLFR